MKAFQARLEELLENIDVSIFVFEQRLNVGHGLISKIRKGERSPSIDLAEKLAAYFKLSEVDRKALIQSALEAKGRRQSRAVPVLDSLERRLNELERDLAIITKEARSAAALATVLIEQCTTGAQKTALQRLLRHLDRGPEKIAAAARSEFVK